MSPQIHNSVPETLSQRASTHGDFKINGQVMQTLKETCHVTPNWHTLAPHQREAIEMICHKLGRILCGNPDHADHWHDIAGYATLVEQLLPAAPTSSI